MNEKLLGSLLRAAFFLLLIFGAYALGFGIVHSSWVYLFRGGCELCIAGLIMETIHRYEL